MFFFRYVNKFIIYFDLSCHFFVSNVIYQGVGYNNQYGSIGESNNIREDYDPNNSVFEADSAGHYNNIPNAMMDAATPTNTGNPVVMMHMTTPLPQVSGQGDDSYHMGGAPRAVFDEEEHQRQLMLMQQGIGDQPPLIQRPKSSMSGNQSRGSFILSFLYFVERFKQFILNA